MSLFGIWKCSLVLDLEVFSKKEGSLHSRFIFGGAGSYHRHPHDRAWLLSEKQPVTNSSSKDGKFCKISRWAWTCLNFIPIHNFHMNMSKNRLCWNQELYIGRGKKNFSSSYVKLSTVATTLANEAGLFPENYVAISGKLQNQKWILYCSSYFANLKASKDVLWHFQLNGSSKLLQSNCINFWKQEKPSSLVLLLFPYRNTFFLYRNIFFPFLYGNIWKYRRKKKKTVLWLL